MSAANSGGEFEKIVYDYFAALIERNEFWAKAECCKIHLHKGYYSRERETDIIFDVAIEVYLPGASEYSILFLIECKDHKRPVAVNHAETFAEAIRQVGGSRTKGIIATTSSFQSGTLAYARAQGLGLLRYFDPKNFVWDLQRTMSEGGVVTPSDIAKITHALTSEAFQSTAFEFYLQSPVRFTNSLHSLFEDLASATGISVADVRSIRSTQHRRSSRVPYRNARFLEKYAATILEKIDYKGGKVPLDAICVEANKRYGLEVRHSVPRDPELPAQVLGRITFNPDVIELFEHEKADDGRDRFTFAHEIAHSVLKHGQYFNREVSDGNEAGLHYAETLSEDILRLEYQANFLASCLLMPAPYLIRQLEGHLKRLGVKPRGVPLYVDRQPVNIQTFNTVIPRLMSEFEVSQTALCIRLENLNQLRDDRTAPKHVSKYLNRRPYKY